MCVFVSFMPFYELSVVQIIHVVDLSQLCDLFFSESILSHKSRLLYVAYCNML